MSLRRGNALTSERRRLSSRNSERRRLGQSLQAWGDMSRRQPCDSPQTGTPPGAPRPAPRARGARAGNFRGGKFRPPGAPPGRPPRGPPGSPPGTPRGPLRDPLLGANIYIIVYYRGYPGPPGDPPWDGHLRGSGLGMPIGSVFMCLLGLWYPTPAQPLRRRWQDRTREEA